MIISKHIKGNLDNIKGIGGPYSLSVTSECWLLYVTISNSSQFSWKSLDYMVKFYWVLT